MLVKDDATILFQGDSVTDCGRSRENLSDLALGYPGIIAAILNAKHPQNKLTFINRGVSGNRVKDLKARWTEDCVALKPDLVSILIGINDTWRRYDSNDATSAEEYKETYREILARVKNETGAKLIVLEPFVLPFPEDRKAWRVDLDPKIAAAREVAVEFGAVYIPLDGIFAAASTGKPHAFWAADGVHPTFNGHMLIAQKWLEAFEA